MKILMLITPEDLSRAKIVQGMLDGAQCMVAVVTPETKSEVYTSAIKNGFDAVITTNVAWVARLVDWKARTQCTLDNFCGSIYYLQGRNPEDKKIPVLILNPFEHVHTTSAGDFLFRRYVSKLTHPERWFKQTAFSWEVLTPATTQAAYNKLATAKWISVDIETVKQDLFITCCSYTGIYLVNGKFETHTVVIPVTDNFMLNWMEKFNALKPPKIFQNGSYDNAYFLRWGCPVYNWMWDTLHLFHCWYSELPKRLDFITAFSVRDIQYWKHESQTSNLQDYYLYNAKDGWATANSFLSMLHEMPEWAINNYIEHEWPMVIPCLHTSMEGVAIDETKRAEIEVTERAKLDSSLTDIRASLGVPNFNPNSPKQVQQLWIILGSKDIKSTDKKAMDKVKARHPLNAFFVEKIVAYRKASKLLGTYTKEAKLLNGRWYAAFDAAGTDTGRLACKPHYFWVGESLQTIPDGIKPMFVADPGFELAEDDFAQSEARCVGYIAGETKLIEVVESGRDYHCVNAELFFGIPYTVTWDNIANKVLKQYKPIRDLSKRTNHGANYNMGDAVMLDTMGITNVIEAKKLLEESATKKIAARNGWQEHVARAFWRGLALVDVCGYLLKTYAETYPRVKTDYYDKVKYDIASTKKLVSALGWTRYCFGNPSKNKPDLNSYVAHGPQNLSVAIINKA